MTTDREHAETLRRTVNLFSPTMPDAVVAATMRAIELLESREAVAVGRMDEAKWYEETRKALEAERDEARQIADLCYEARTGDPSVVDAAIEAWLNRSWKADS